MPSETSYLNQCYMELNPKDLQKPDTSSKSADDTKPSSVVDTPEGWDAIQRDLGKFEKWAHGNLMQFNKTKCKVLHLGWGNPWYQSRVGDEQIKSSPEGKDLGVLVGERLDMSWQYALASQKANHDLVCIRSVASGLREVFLLLCSGETPSAVLHPALGSPAQEGHGAVEVSPKEGHQDD
ncbi:rna-directed dna polymerase from mobile element jockey-like [Willisornis vidua]|uniref:Rna-directed dna polymerase from mobile element jockey-like n=1 Tax=Willisornis vidua TaxID=1566151 RepID=A0ABQ9DG96_9PASS|nr:rna-directed dna polymerase from mobile element jockey-like [Willisornis vidua]